MSQTANNNHKTVDFEEITALRGDNAIELENVDWHKKPSEAAVATLINYALQQSASDVFLACEEGEISVTIRQLGVIRRIAELPLENGFRCIAHIRAMAGLRIDERKHPLDGRWVFQSISGAPVDLRLNTIPTLYGETLAMRVLPRNSELQRLENLGFAQPQLDLLDDLLQRPSGLVLVTGPTGSGKSTTLYALLHSLNSGRLKIHTIEDPIEYSVPGLHQSQVNESKGAGFAEYLRAIMRQGPDVIMLGEVRDSATAETAVRAANSGQLVFASVHAPVAVKAIQSMLAMGVSPYLLCSSLVAVVGQRLMRTLDPSTRTPLDLSLAPQTFDEVRPWLNGNTGSTVYAAPPNGGAVNSGYSGRTGIFEVLAMNPRLQRMLAEQQPTDRIFQQALNDGMIDFRRAALLKVAQGETSFDEMYRTLPTSDELQDESLIVQVAPV